MAPMLMGLESEYALAGYGPARRYGGEEGLVGLLLETARSHLLHLPGAHDTGMFLANGSRFYIDAGGHPEMCTPECTNPWDLVRYCFANERTLAVLLETMRSSLPPGSDLALFKCNVDYADTMATWGCHESYLHRMDPPSLHEQLIPHLVSRVIYTGAGGFDSTSSGLTFLLSPRVAHITQVSSEQSTGDRGIIHTKDESLSGHRYHRLHLICGESLCSETALWLKFGVTALIVAMIEGGVAPAMKVVLADPLAAFRDFAADPTCSATALTQDGRRLRALDIQRIYLSHAERSRGAAFLPDWAGPVCDAWGEMLDRLEGAPTSVATSLDWAIKHALYGAHLRRRGLSWNAGLCWTEVIEEIFRSAPPGGMGERPASLEKLIGPHGPRRLTAAMLSPLLREHGESWDRLPLFQQVRRELCELDMRFGQIGPRGLFAQLDRDRLLTHKVEGVEPIDPAGSVPPREGRAHLRGEWIRSLASGRKRARCGWEMILDYEQRRMLDLSDPLGTAETWTEMPSWGGRSTDMCDFGFWEDPIARRREIIRRRLTASESG